MSVSALGNGDFHQIRTFQYDVAQTNPIGKDQVFLYMLNRNLPQVAFANNGNYGLCHRRGGNFFLGPSTLMLLAANGPCQEVSGAVVLIRMATLCWRR
jgi:hypothetical protein